MKKLVLVYGTLKAAHGNHRVMGDSKLLGTHTTDPRFTMYDGGFPIVRSSGTTPITGEVYEVTNEETLKRIYSLEGYTGERGHEDNWYDTVEVETPYGTAEMFVQHQEIPTRRVVESGIWH